MRLFDVLSNFAFTTSETIGDYYLWTRYIGGVSPVAEPLKTLGYYEISGNGLNFIKW